MIDVFLETGLHNSAFWFFAVFCNGLHLAQEVSLLMTVFIYEYKGRYLASN